VSQGQSSAGLYSSKKTWFSHITYF